jgi:Protein of unknown function (DUF2490)
MLEPAGGKQVNATIRLIVLASSLSILAAPGFVAAQSQTESEFWPTVNARFELPHKWRALASAGLKKGEENQYQQLNAGAGIARQFRPILRPHTKNADLDKEHTFVVGAGYERLQVFQSGTESNENRLTLQAMSAFRPTSQLYLSDRNRVECRWRGSGYSTRYRNNAQALYDVTIRGFHFSPYGSAEFFYDGASGEWSREQYTGGVEWTLPRKLTVQTYYLRQNNATNPKHLNVAGLTLNMNFDFK